MFGGSRVRLTWTVLAGALALFCAGTPTVRADDVKPPEAPAIPAEPPPAPPPPGDVEPGSVKGLEPTPTAPSGAAGTPAAPDAPAPPPPPPPGVTKPADPTTTTNNNWSAVAPTRSECSSACNRCIGCMPEAEMPIWAPDAGFQIPWTGQYNTRQRNWALFANESLTYDTNIYLGDEDNEVSDWISHTSVGGSYRREGGQFAVLASLAVTGDVYFEHSSNDNVNLFGILEAGWRSGCGLYASLTDRLAFTENPLVVIDNNFVTVDQERDPYWVNTLVARVGYEGCKWRLEGQYENTFFFAETGITDDFNHWDNGFRGRFDYFLSEKTSVGAYAGVRFLSYEESSQNDFTTYEAGFAGTWRPDAKWSFALDVGVASLEPDGDSNQTTGTGSFAVGFEATDRLSLRLLYTRSYEPAIGADDQLIDTLALRAYLVPSSFWQWTGSVGAQLGDAEGTTLNSTKDYTLWFVNLGVHHQFNACWGADALYQLRVQDSDQNGTDYVDNRFTVGVTFTF